MPDRGDERYAVLEAAGRIWAVGAVHGETARLRHLHEALGDALVPGDRLVYLGNLLGVGDDPAGTVDELLRFRRLALMLPGAEPWDVVVLRGGQEEMWQRLLQLQFALAPGDVFDWMIGQGLEPTLRAYGGTLDEARRAMRQGTLSLTRWTSSIRGVMHAKPGHESFMASLRRFAVDDARGLLFVSAGIDAARPLDGQRDTFWWGAAGFNAMTAPYGDFRRVVRGYDLDHRGPEARSYHLTVDGGAGFDGALIAECLAPSGEVLARLTA